MAKSNYISSPYKEVGLHGQGAKGIIWDKYFGVQSLRNTRKKKRTKKK